MLIINPINTSLSLSITLEILHISASFMPFMLPRIGSRGNNCVCDQPPAKRSHLWCPSLVWGEDDCQQ